MVRWVSEKVLESYRNGITAGQKGATVKRHANPLACRYCRKRKRRTPAVQNEDFLGAPKKPKVRNVMLERPFGTNRADVSAEINGVPVAIEVQISSLSLETITQRTMEYARKGIFPSGDGFIAATNIIWLGNVSFAVRWEFHWLNL